MSGAERKRGLWKTKQSEWVRKRGMHLITPSLPLPSRQVDSMIRSTVDRLHQKHEENRRSKFSCTPTYGELVSLSASHQLDNSLVDVFSLPGRSSSPVPREVFHRIASPSPSALLQGNRDSPVSGTVDVKRQRAIRTLEAAAYNLADMWLCQAQRDRIDVFTFCKLQGLDPLAFEQWLAGRGCSEADGEKIRFRVEPYVFERFLGGRPAQQVSLPWAAGSAMRAASVKEMVNVSRTTRDEWRLVALRNGLPPPVFCELFDLPFEQFCRWLHNPKCNDEVVQTTVESFLRQARHLQKTFALSLDARGWSTADFCHENNVAPGDLTAWMEPPGEIRGTEIAREAKYQNSVVREVWRFVKAIERAEVTASFVPRVALLQKVQLRKPFEGPAYVKTCVLPRMLAPVALRERPRPEKYKLEQVIANSRRLEPSDAKAAISLIRLVRQGIVPREHAKAMRHAIGAEMSP